MNEETRARLRSCAHRIVTAIRRYLDSRGVRRGGDADPPAALRRRVRRAVRHALQRARRRPLPADRDRALPQAADRRRARAGLRDRQGLPQRERLLQAPARVHDARVVRGVRGLPRHDGPDRGAASGAAASEALGTTKVAVPRPRDRLRAAVAAPRVRRVAGGARALDPRRGRAARVAGRSAGVDTSSDTDLGAARRPRVLALRRAGADRADDRPRLPGRAVAVRTRDGRRPGAHRALRVLRRRDGARQRVLRDQRRGDAGRALRRSRRGSSAASRATRTTSRRWRTGCRRPAASVSASTGWRWC